MEAFFSYLPNPIVICAAIGVTVLYLRLKGNALPRPPGPKRLPIIGNLLQVPISSKLWELAADWGKIYGDFVYIELAGMPLLFVNSYDTAVDILDKRSSTTASRPPLVMLNELSKWDYLTVNMPYGDRQRKHRQHFHRFFQTSEAISNNLKSQQRRAHALLNDILNEPDNYGKHVRRLVGSVILMNVYGHEDAQDNEKYFAMGAAAIRAQADARPYLILDTMPWLRYIPEWLPIMGFHKMAKEHRALSTLMQYEAHEETKKKILDGTARKSLTSILMEESTDAEGQIKAEDEGDIAAVATTAFTGGSDTSVTAIMTFVLAILKNPEVQRLGQEELDRVVGKDRLPTFEDRANLPYVRAICSEILRWEIIVPIQAPHYTTADEIYKGYFIPKGTSVVANNWALSKNSEMYPDPCAFKPERWMPGYEGQYASRGVSAPIPAAKYLFGFGRRVCPGQDWAESIIFIAVASLLAAFNIEKAIGPDGQPIPPNDEYYEASARTLSQSVCKITPRSRKIAAVIRELADSQAL